MSLYKRGSTWWARINDERVSTGQKTKALAERWLVAEMRRRADPAREASERYTLNQCLSDYIKHLRGRKRAQATILYYKQKFGHLVRVFGEISLISVNAKLVDEYAGQRRKEGCSEASLSKELNALKSALTLAYRHALFADDPVRVVQPIGHKYSPKKRVCSPEEVTRLIEGASATLARQIAFAAATGARWSEINAAQGVDLDRQKQTVFIRGTKTAAAREGRLIPVWPSTKSLIELAFGEQPEGRLFPDMHRPPRLDQLATKLKMPVLSWNDLRRTFATRLLESGCEPWLVAKLLGHTSSQMVERVYAKPSAEKLISLALEMAKPTISGGQKNSSLESKITVPILCLRFQKLGTFERVGRGVLLNKQTRLTTQKVAKSSAEGRT